MPVKVTRRFAYIVEGKEYPDQKTANDAAKEANWREKQAIVAEIIKQAHNPIEAAAAIMAKYYVFNKKDGSKPHNKRKKREYMVSNEIDDEVEIDEASH
jgi:hypothetical protein